MTAKGILAFIAVALIVIVSAFAFTAQHRADELAATKDTEINSLKNEIANLKNEVGELKSRIFNLEAGVKKLSMTASWYGPGFNGRKASDGSIFNQQEYTCAHRTLPFGTILIIEYKGKRVPAVVTDRGPFIKGRDIDLSLSLAQRLGFTDTGVVKVTVYQWSVS